MHRCMGRQSRHDEICTLCFAQLLGVHQAAEGKEHVAAARDRNILLSTQVKELDTQGIAAQRQSLTQLT